MNLIDLLGGYEKAKKVKDQLGNTPTYGKYLIIVNGKFLGFTNTNLYGDMHVTQLLREMLEYRRFHELFEPGDYVFLRDQNYPDLYVVTNILDDGRIEIKTGSRGFPVPESCWGLYYQGPEGLRHATDEELGL